jgi:hypothetical protein
MFKLEEALKQAAWKITSLERVNTTETEIDFHLSEHIKNGN